MRAEYRLNSIRTEQERMAGVIRFVRASTGKHGQQTV